MIPRIHLGHAVNPQFLTVNLNMLRWLNKRAETTRRARKLYGAVVTAARHPAFYAAFGVPDTPEGRFELITLHLYLALEGLRGTMPEADDLSQRMIETFVADMDDCMREMGVGDLAVPKRVKRAAATFYERATIYQRDLSEVGENRLAASLANHVFAGAAHCEDTSRALARYVRRASSALAVDSFDDWAESGAAAQLADISASTIGKTVT